MDTLGRDRWDKPFKPYKPASSIELKLALVLYGHIRRRPGIPTRFLGRLSTYKQMHSRVLGRMHGAKLITYHRDVRNHYNANYRDMEWIPTKKGDQWYDRHLKKFPELETEPRRGLNSWYPHASGCSVIGASFDIAVLEHRGLILSYYEHEPQVYDGLEPDEPPFFLRYEWRIDIAGIEYDRGTMSLTDFGEKLANWNRYYLNKHYLRHDMQAPYTLVISNSPNRTDNLKQSVRDHINERFQPRFWFKTIPDFLDHKLPPATGFIFSEPWQLQDGTEVSMKEKVGWTSSASNSSSKTETTSTRKSESV